MITIKDLLEITCEMIEKQEVKVHFATGAKRKTEPLLEYYKGKFKQWQESQTRKNFERKYILSLIWYDDNNSWLFAGVYERISVIDNYTEYIYETILLEYAKDLIGRLIIKYNKPYRNSYPFLESCIEKFELSEILREPYTVQAFPGYDKILISFDELKAIISQGEPSWQTALSNQKGVYLIADKQTGKLYVGSAYGEYSFWGRWQIYADTGHGGNVDLKDVIRQNGIEYGNNFQFSILETRIMNTPDDQIIDRESYWKKILLSKEFGYNNN